MSPIEIHGSILAVALAAYYKYGDRADVFSKSLQGAEALLKRLRSNISSDLARHLEPVFRSPGSLPSPILTPHESTYVEHPVNPVGSERYRESIRTFLEEAAGSIADYRSVVRACDAWCFWARVRSWAIIFLLMWQFLAVVLLFVLMLIDNIFPDSVIYATFIPSILSGFVAMISLPFIEIHHNTIIRSRRRYDVP